MPEKIRKEAPTEMILNYLEKHVEIVRKEAEKILNVGERRARVILSEMVKNETLEKRGKSSNTYYVLK